jgi:hypothetical protein
MLRVALFMLIVLAIVLGIAAMLWRFERVRLLVDAMARKRLSRARVAIVATGITLLICVFVAALAVTVQLALQVGAPDKPAFEAAYALFTDLGGIMVLGGMVYAQLAGLLLGVMLMVFGGTWALVTTRLRPQLGRHLKNGVFFLIAGGLFAVFPVGFAGAARHSGPFGWGAYLFLAAAACLGLAAFFFYVCSLWFWRIPRVSRLTARQTKNASRSEPMDEHDPVARGPRRPDACGVLGDCVERWSRRS